MNILSVFKSRDKPKVSDSAVSSAPSFYFGPSGSNKNVTVRTSVQVTTVYACVRVIAETIASLPLHVYEGTDSGARKAIEHPLYHILHDEPNTEMTSFAWRETTLSHLLLWGNAYSQIIRNGRGAVIGLSLLLPENMKVDRDDSGQLIYTYTTTDGRSVVLNQQQVLHIPGMGFDGIVGYSPIALEKNAVGLGIAAEEYGSKFFANGATPSGVLTHPNTVRDPARVRESWNAAYGGSANSHKVAVLEEGMTFNPISIPNSEAQFLETRKFQVSEICRMFRVPPHLVADLEHATFSNIEHQSISFGVHTIRPWLTRIEQTMNKALFSKTEKGRFYVSFNMDGLLRGDYKSRMEGYAIARQNGWMSANDIRELENMNPLPPESGGDVYMVNGNMITIIPESVSNKQRELELERADLEMTALREQSNSIKHSVELSVKQSEAQLEAVQLQNESSKAQAEIAAKAAAIQDKTMQESADIAMETTRLQLEQLQIQVEELRMQLEASRIAFDLEKKALENADVEDVVVVQDGEESPGNGQDSADTGEDANKSESPVDESEESDDSSTDNKDEDEEVKDDA